MVMKRIWHLFCQHASIHEHPNRGAFFVDWRRHPENEAHLRCIKRVASQPMKQPSAMKRAFGTRRSSRALRFMAQRAASCKPTACASCSRSECFIDKATNLCFKSFKALSDFLSLKSHKSIDKQRKRFLPRRLKC